MSRTRVRTVLADTLKKHRLALMLFLLSIAANYVIFRLYGLRFEPFLYAAGFVAFFGIAFFGISFLRALRAAAGRDRLRETLFADAECDGGATLADDDYQQMIQMLRERLETLTAEQERIRLDNEDYMMVWVHQIKTPISVIRMMLSDRDEPISRSVLAEVFRIEQYVEMLLQYARLSSQSADLVIQEYSLDELIRESIRKYAQLFLLRGLSIRYDGTDAVVVTDRKWLCCILDQLLSNAVKYTPSGSVAITVSDHHLRISDTGIGIAPEDLPRVFERGYTGTNGRRDMRASGLGLYLAKAAADKLAVSLGVESTLGRGTTFELRFPKEN